MPKHLTLGNGKILIGLDDCGLVKDFYYHYPGLENHVSEGMLHKIGVWVEEKFSWFDGAGWDIKVESERGTMAGKVTAENKELGITIVFSDIVYNERNIFIRDIEINNHFDRLRQVKVFFNQQFNTGRTGPGDTAYFDPSNHAVIHYKGRRVFLVNTVCFFDNGKKKGIQKFSEYSTGILGLEGREGTYKDAEDGVLGGNPIEHGQVDSVIGIEIEIAPSGNTKFYYWITVAKSVGTVCKLNEYVLQRGPSEIVKSTKDYWKAWVYNQKFSFYGLSDPVIDLFNKSLVQIRTHVASNGAIIASSDSDLLKHGRDTYSYVWPRDAAFCAIALAKAGDFNASRRFFEFCNKVISKQGYFMHKYLPDYSLGSSWHPWVRDGKKQIPIQEDETALVIYALWTHFELSKDLEFIETIYNTLIRNAAEFMVDYRDKTTGLPKPSYDMWEEKYGINTFTSSAVFGALQVASQFARTLGKEKNAVRYKRAAEKIREGILNNLYNEEEGIFYKLIRKDGASIEIDKTLDFSSCYGIYKFGVLPVTDARLKRAFDISVERLSVKTKVGGIARYEGDWYHRVAPDVPGNPWFITNAWYIQYLIELLENQQQLPDLVKRFNWFVDHALPSGVLPEQLNPISGGPLSAAPLTWSHSEYVITIISYLEKLEKMGICKACYPVNRN